MKKNLRQLLPLAAACATTLMLAACGSGSSTSADPAPPAPPVVPAPATTLSGTAAVGAPVAGSVVAIDSKGKVSVAVLLRLNPVQQGCFLRQQVLQQSPQCLDCLWFQEWLDLESESLAAVAVSRRNGSLYWFLLDNVPK